MPTVHTEHIYVEKNLVFVEANQLLLEHVFLCEYCFRESAPGIRLKDIHRSYPHLTLAQIHDALSYCYDHVDEINKYIQEEEAAYCQKKQ